MAGRSSHAKKNIKKRLVFLKFFLGSKKITAWARHPWDPINQKVSNYLRETLVFVGKSRKPYVFTCFFELYFLRKAP